MTRNRVLRAILAAIIASAFVAVPFLAERFFGPGAPDVFIVPIMPGLAICSALEPMGIATFDSSGDMTRLGTSVLLGVSWLTWLAVAVGMQVAISGSRAAPQSAAANQPHSTR